MRTIELGNSAYDNGMQLGRLDRDMYRLSYRLNCLVGTWAQWARNDSDPGYAARVAACTQEDALAWAERIHHEKMAALPDISRYPELKGRDRYLTDEARGLAEGADLDLRAIYLLRYGHEVRERLRERPPSVPSPTFACTCVLQNDSPDGPIAGFNCDDSMIWAEFHATRPREVTLLKHTAGQGYSYVNEGPRANEKGLVVAGVGGGSFEQEQPSPESFPANVPEMVLRCASSVAQAVEILTRYALFWGPSNLALMDADGNMAIVEKSHRRLAVRYPKGKCGFTTYGGVEDPGLCELLDCTSPVYRYYTQRIERLAKLAAPDECPGPSRVLTMLADHGGCASICQHDDGRPQGIHLCTVSRGINLLGSRVFRMSRVTRSSSNPGGWQFPCESDASEDQYYFQ